MDRLIVAVHESLVGQTLQVTISQSPPLTRKERAPDTVAPSTNYLEVDFGARVDWGQIRPKESPEGEI